MPIETFDPLKELSEVKELRAVLRRKLYRKSKLERYRTELVAMRRHCASCQDLATWLRRKHRLKINRSTIDRYLSNLPELATISAASQPAP